jgi:hypothetical protein
VIKGMDADKKSDLLQAFLNCEIHLTNVEIV